MGGFHLAQLMLFCRDRLRTSINVWGDCIGSAVIEKLSRKDLRSTNGERTADKVRLSAVLNL